MKAHMELQDYTNAMNASESPRGIVENVEFDTTMVTLQFNGYSIKVVGRELIAAVQNCLNIPS